MLLKYIDLSGAEGFAPAVQKPDGIPVLLGLRHFHGIQRASVLPAHDNDLPDHPDLARGKALVSDTLAPCHLRYQKYTLVPHFKWIVSCNPSHPLQGMVGLTESSVERRREIYV